MFLKRSEQFVLVFVIIQFLLRHPFVAGFVRSSGCYSDRSDPYVFFSTKTSYFAVDNEETDVITYPGCQARSFWFLARHGTRNPGKKDVGKMIKKSAALQTKILSNHHQHSRGQLCEADLAGLAAWNLTVSADEESLLTDSGRQEHFTLGQRYKKRLPDLLGGNFDTEIFKFRHTHKIRTEDSAKAFARGIFPEEGEAIFQQPDNFTELDKLLRFYDFCQRWTLEVDENEETYSEQKLFLKTQIVEDMLSRVGQRLGFDSNDGPFTIDDASLVYDICRFEKAWSPDDVSYWCAAFEDEDLQVFEYHEELKYWYNAGYYYTISTQFACPILQDLVEKFGGKSGRFDENDSTKIYNATFYFSHSEALLPFITLLGLYRDEKRMRHNNFDAMVDRQFRTSKIGAFSSNIAFILYDCNGAKKIAALHQEKPIRLPGCEEELCDWHQFIEAYEEKLTCNFDQICSLNQSKMVPDILVEDDYADNGKTSKGTKAKSTILISLFVLGHILIHSISL